jgi:hypothetical protein
VLKHKEISQLINFLKTAKERVSKLPDPNNIVAEKLINIDQLLNQAHSIHHTIPPLPIIIYESAVLGRMGEKIQAGL